MAAASWEQGPTAEAMLAGEVPLPALAPLAACWPVARVRPAVALQPEPSLPPDASLAAAGVPVAWLEGAAGRCVALLLRCAAPPSR